jgi:hypothetical protein
MPSLSLKQSAARLAGAAAGMFCAVGLAIPMFDRVGHSGPISTTPVVGKQATESAPS